MSRLPTLEYYYMHLGSGTPIAGAGVAIRGPIWNACLEAYAIFLQASLQPKTFQTPPAAAKRSTNACGSKGLDERSPVSPHRLPSLQVCAMRSTCCSLASPHLLPIFPSGPLIDIRDILLADAVQSPLHYIRLKTVICWYLFFAHLALILCQPSSLIHILWLVSNKHQARHLFYNQVATRLPWISFEPTSHSDKLLLPVVTVPRQRRERDLFVSLIIQAFLVWLLACCAFDSPGRPELQVNLSQTGSCFLGSLFLITYWSFPPLAI